MSDVAAIEQLVKDYNALKNEIHQVIVGQDEVVDQVLISIFRCRQIVFLTPFLNVE